MERAQLTFHIHSDIEQLCVSLGRALPLRRSRVPPSPKYLSKMYGLQTFKLISITTSRVDFEGDVLIDGDRLAQNTVTAVACSCIAIRKLLGFSLAIKQETSINKEFGLAVFELVIPMLVRRCKHPLM